MLEPNLRLQALAMCCALVCGILLRLPSSQWVWIVFAVGIVVLAELLNTAIERLVDLTVGTQQQLLARQVKDVSAGIVLASCVMAMVIGVLVFVPQALR